MIAGQANPALFSLFLCWLALLCLPPLTPRAHAGAWLLDQGRGKIIFSSRLTDAPQRFDRRGKARSTDRFIKQEGFTLVEYGIHEHITFTGGLGSQRAFFLFDEAQARVDAYAGAVGLRARLWQGSGLVLSAQTTVLGRTERAIPAPLRRLEPRLETDIRLLGGYGLALGPVSGFGEIQAGYRWRSDRHADEWRFDATIGIRPVPKVLLLIHSFNTLAVTRDQRFGLSAQRQHKMQVSAVADITERMSVQIGVFGSVKGRESLRERGVMMAVWRQF